MAICRRYVSLRHTIRVFSSLHMRYIASHDLRACIVTYASITTVRHLFASRAISSGFSHMVAERQRLAIYRIRLRASHHIIRLRARSISRARRAYARFALRSHHAGPRHRITFTGTDGIHTAMCERRCDRQAITRWWRWRDDCCVQAFSIRHHIGVSRYKCRVTTVRSCSRTVRYDGGARNVAVELAVMAIR